MDREYRKDIIRDFQPLINQENPIAILVFGSHVDGNQTEQSDIDICIVTGDKSIIDEMLSIAWQTVGDRYDLWIFEELPIYIQSEVIDKHEIIYARSEPEFYEYLYHYRKLSDDYKYRLKVTYGEI